MSSRILVDEIEPKTASLVCRKWTCRYSSTKNNSQSISATTYTTIQYDDVEFDSHNYFNASTYLYQPLVAGCNEFNAGVWATALTQTLKFTRFNFSKNGGTQSEVVQRVSSIQVQK